MLQLHDWALRHGVSLLALQELGELFGHFRQIEAMQEFGINEGDPESKVQGIVRMRAATLGFMLQRNNVGALKDERGVPVRFGLLNDTAALNKVAKSSDLIGWRSENWVHPDTGVLTKIARFVAIECKAADWPGHNPTDEHERAQQRYLEMVVAAGGLAMFSTGGLPT